MNENIILDSADDIYMGIVRDYVKYSFYMDDFYEKLQEEIKASSDKFKKGMFISLNNAYMLSCNFNSDYGIYVSFEHRTGKKGEKVIIKMLEKMIENVLLKERTRRLQSVINEKKQGRA